MSAQDWQDLVAAMTFSGVLGYFAGYVSGWGEKRRETARKEREG